MDSAPSLVQSLRLYARVAAELVAILGMAVLAGWAFDVELLKAAIPGHVTMKANAALAFLLAGSSARLLCSERTGRRLRLAARAAGAAVAAIGLATLFEYVAGLDLGIDELLFRDAPRAFQTHHPGRMAPGTALAFLLLGVSLAIHDLETVEGGRPSQLLALVASLVPLQAMVGFVYGVEPMRGLAASTHLALHAAFGLALLSTAVLADRPDKGLMAIFTDRGLAGFMVRRLVAAIVVLPIALGWLFLVAGMRVGQYEAMLGASFVVVSAIVVGAAVVWWNAVALRELEADKTKQREWLRTTLASIGDAVIATDRAGRVTLVNAVAEQLTGWKEAEAAGLPLGEVFRAMHEETRQPIEDPVSRVLDSGGVESLPARTLLASRAGTEHPVGGSAAPIQAPRGETLGVVLVASDMTERRRGEAERAGLLGREQLARAEAEKASRAKDEFIATVSHELRTPLNAVLGWARLLRTGKLDADATARAVEAIERSAGTQARIVDDLLDVSRIVRGKLKLDVRPVELVPVIEAAIDTVRPAAAAKGIAIAASLASRAGPVAGDPGRLQQVVWNLLSNAIKFTPQGGRVEVKLSQAREVVRIQVADTGPGIDADFLPHVFERFRQADQSSTRAHGGLGIGLAIVRHLVEAHGGTVAVESPGRGRGATFTVDLPVQTARRTQAAAASPGDGAERTGQGLQELKVLIVDDDAETLQVVRQLLEQAGAEVTAATSASEALAALERSLPDVLLSDIGMPDEDGFSLIRKVRGLDAARGGRIPAAALTAYTQSEDRRQALLAGYQMYLAKPVDPAELTAAVARLAGRA
jgi:PAS domain S-box-containing protein